MEGHGYGGTRIWKRYGNGRDTDMEGTRIWRGHEYGREIGIEGTFVWKGHGCQGQG